MNASASSIHPLVLCVIKLDYGHKSHCSNSNLYHNDISHNGCCPDHKIEALDEKIIKASINLLQPAAI
jgi:hypothetical protein